MSAANYTTPTVAALNAVKDKLVALQWTPPSGPAVAAFGNVALYDMTDLAQALRELLAFKDRVALVIHDSESWEHAVEGQELRSEEHTSELQSQ